MFRVSFWKLFGTDIMAITDTWMTENDPLEGFQIDGYQPIVSNPRKKFKRRSGGAAFYIEEGIKE